MPPRARCAGVRAACYPRGCDTRSPARLSASLAESARYPRRAASAATPLALGHLAGSRPFNSLSHACPRVRCCRARLPPAQCCHLGSPRHQSTGNGCPPCNGHQRRSHRRIVRSPRSVRDCHVHHPSVKSFPLPNPSMCLRHYCTSSLLALHPFASNICTARRHNTRNFCPLQSISPFNAQ
jgi:hypothetical protein